MTAPKAPGIRDRKRAETQARIEAAATSLVLRDGLDETTVDAISERADISTRTFFNYFDSKDSAILGLQPRDLADDVLQEQLSANTEADDGSDDVIAAVVRLVLAVMGAPAPTTTSVHRDRMEIIRRYPEIVSSQFAQLTARKNRMADAVRRLLTAHPDFSDDNDAAARAEVVLALCASATRAALQEWADTADPDTADTIEQRAVALVTSTIRRLA